VETLSLKGMARRKKGYRFGRSVADNGYGQFVEVLTQQAG
jgi:transposase